MRLKELRLSKYGAFDGQVLRFQGTRPGLHIVFGHNEAGKSTALRALKALLFGIAPRTRDNFLFGNDVLSVGALIQTCDGREIEVQRFKKSPSLRDKKGQPLEPSVIGLNGVDEAAFARFFGIDYEELRSGSAMLLAEKDFGTALFSAGLDRNLGAVLAEFESRAGELFKPRASTKTINAMIKEYNDTMREAKEAALKPKDFSDKEAELEAANAELHALQQKEHELRAAQAKLERIGRTRKNAAKLRDLERRLAELGDVTPLPAGFILERRQAAETLRRLAEEIGKGKRKIENIDADLARLEIPAAIIGESLAITALQQDLTRYCSARDDHPKLTAQVELLKRAAEQILKRLRPNAVLADAKALQPRDDQARRILDLAKLEPTLRTKYDTFAADARRLESQLHEEREMLARLVEPRATDRVRAVMKSVQKKGDLEAALAAENEALASRRADADNALQRLPLWHGTLEQLVALKTPIAETLDDFERAFQRIQSRQGTLATEIKGQEAQIASCRAELDRIREECGTLPTVTELQSTRGHRERGWVLIRRAWLQREDVESEAAVYAPGTPLAEAYEKSVREADSTADHRYRDARRVEVQEDRLRRIAAAECERAALTIQRNACDAELKSEQSRWHALWEELGIAPESVAAMRNWLVRQQQVLQKHDALEGGKRECALRESALADARRDVLAPLEEVGETGLKGRALHDLISQAEQFCEKQDALLKKRAKCEEAVERTAVDWRKKIVDRDAAETKLKEWQEKWADAVSALQLRPDALVGEATETLTKIDELFKKLDPIPELERRMGQVSEAITNFESRTAALAGRIDPDMKRLAPNKAAELLHGRLTAAQNDQARAGELHKQRAEVVRLNTEAGAQAESLKARVDELRAAAGCADASELDAVERRFEAWLELRKKIDAATEMLLDAGDGLDREALFAESESIDADALAAQLVQTKSGLDALEPQRRSAHDAFSGIKLERDKMDGGARAAEASGQAQLILAQIRDAVEEYVRLRTAAAILKAEIERFQDANQTPLLRHAGRFFATLTRGAFSALRGESSGTGENTLMGVRSDQSPLGIEGMSDGTRDQLYLALRLAYLQWHFDRDNTEAPPFVVDDVLVNFDDVRCEAAFKVLHELSARIQIIVFTHHRHIVDIARSSCPLATHVSQQNQTLEVHSFEVAG